MLWMEDDDPKLSVLGQPRQMIVNPIEGKIKNLIYNNIQKEILLRIEIE